jgi:acyl-CoA thioester hydrolase
MYSKTLVAGWGDMDFNAHMGAAAYLVKCFDVRIDVLCGKRLSDGRIRPSPIGAGRHEG